MVGRTAVRTVRKEIQIREWNSWVFVSGTVVKGCLGGGKGSVQVDVMSSLLVRGPFVKSLRMA